MDSSIFSSPLSVTEAAVLGTIISATFLPSVAAIKLTFSIIFQQTPVRTGLLTSVETAKTVLLIILLKVSALTRVALSKLGIRS